MSKFRIQNTRLHLTYPKTIRGDLWIAWFEDKFGKKCKIVEYSIVNEIGEMNHEHTHVLVKFDKNFESRNCNIFDFESAHPNINPVKTKNHWDNTAKYHHKQYEPYTNIVPVKSVIREVWSYPTLAEAIEKTCTSLAGVGGAIAAFKHKPKDYGVEPDTTWRPWQSALSEELNVENKNDRKIIWYFDETGKSGKSYFARHMGMFRDAFVSAKANPYHIATQLQDTLESGGVLMVIFNFTRQNDYNNKVYEAIESIKDGMVTAEKYHGKTLFFNSPHLVVFANYKPITSMITSDRWDVRYIPPSGMTAIKVPVDKVNTDYNLSV